jgi:hypothetical protein
MIVALVRVDLGNTESEKRERQKLEYIFGSFAIGNLGEEAGFFGRGCGVCGGLEGTESTFYCGSR